MKRIFLSLPFACLLFGCTPAPDASTEASPQTLAAGKEVYTVNCVRCHSADGSGVKDMQPPLVNDPIANGDPTMLIRVVLQGPAVVFPDVQPKYPTAMPGFGPALTDQQIADVLTYIRHDFNDQASMIDVHQVQTVRSQFGP